MEAKSRLSSLKLVPGIGYALAAAAGRERVVGVAFPEDVACAIHAEVLIEHGYASC